MRAIAALLLCLLVLPAWGEETTVYKRARPDGSIEFSDTPFPDSQAIQVQQVPVYQSPPVPKIAPKQDDQADANRAYKQMAITNPAAESTVFFDEGGLPVSVSVEPALKKGHVVVIYLDGRRVASAPSTSLKVPDVFRGAHTLVAAVENASHEELLRSRSVTFYLTQHTVNPQVDGNNANGSNSTNPYGLAPLPGRHPGK